MAEPIAVIIRFRGDPNELLKKFEQARQSWIADQQPGYERPLFYAHCKTEDGIAVVSGWATAAAHRAFGQGLHPQIHRVGLGRPDRIERMRVKDLGWAEVET